ncbi:MAG TPA: hypothetical protein VHA05_01805 [Candidatus Saccharimonadales bacterium]|nr:hypothetical protein [Candidatus Saccharimonadales bacterium]
MKQVPYHGNPGNACALACYTMAAQYLLPEKHFTFERLAEKADWHKGYVVWGFRLWKWLMDHGVHIVDYDTIDYQAWADNGAEGLRASVPPKEFEFYQKNTFDLEEESKRVSLMLDHPNFSYKKQKPTWGDVVREHNLPGIVDVTVNKRHLDREEGFVGHRVILLDITDNEVVFHDPNRDGSGKERREPLEHFRTVFEAQSEPELARYYL